MVTAEAQVGNSTTSTVETVSALASLQSAAAEVATINPWSARAAELAQWATRYFARADRYGGYYTDDSISTQTCTRPTKGPKPKCVNARLLERHFRAAGPKDVIGAHCLAPDSGAGDSGGRFAGVDIDAHPGAVADPAANERYAIHVYEKAAGVGLVPLMYESNGRGGFHCVVFFDAPKPRVPGPWLYGLARWLVSEYASFGLSMMPETFPKQSSVKAGGFGNWLRVVGRHHTRDYWPRVWDGRKWLEGAAAVEHVLSIPQCDPGLIPFDALELGAKDASGPDGTSAAGASGDRPGDDFNRRGGDGAAREILQRHGWTFFRDRGAGISEWTRPGKDTGCSGTLGFCSKGDTAKLYCWSSNAAPLEQGKTYTPFSLLAAFEHGKDFAATAADLRRAGYGSVSSANGKPHASESVDGPKYPPPIEGETWNDPHRLARLFVSDRMTPERDSTLIQWRDEFHRWDGAAWKAMADSDLDAQVADHCRKVFVADYPHRLAGAESRAEKAEGEKAEEEKKKPVVSVTLFPVTLAVKGNTRLNLSALTNWPDDGTDAPFWLDSPGAERPDATEVIAAPNGLFTLSDVAAGRGPFAKPTPRFFTPNAMPFSVPNEAPTPATWHQCLKEWFDGDASCILGLQEWFGLLLTASTDCHKILMLPGPPRSGKGTVLHVLQELVGSGNVASTTFARLGESFGLQNLLSKRVAIVPDARLSVRPEQLSSVVERLLSISGEDLQSVNRKNLPEVSTKLRVRFVLATNEIPRLPDASGALASRFHILPMPNSFLGKEDRGLKAKLGRELPGILNWAAKGWVRLRTQGMVFTQNDKAREHHRELEDLSSPIRAFVRQCCLIGPGHDVEIPTLYDAWRTWNELRRREVGSEGMFGRDLRTVLPQIRTFQRRDDSGWRKRWYAGVRTKDRADWGEEDGE